MNINLYFPELSHVIDSEEISLSKNNVEGLLPDIQIIKNDGTQNELNNDNLIDIQNYKKSDPSKSVSIIFGCFMILFLILGRLYYIVHFYDLLQFVHYLLFINVNYPYILNQILHIFGFANFEVLPNIKNSDSDAPVKFNL